MPVSGSTLVAAQRTIRLVTFSRAAPIAISCSDQAELVPGRPARRHRDWRGSAADGPARRPRSRSPPREARLMIETTLAATSEKLWPSACEHLGRAAQLRRHEAAEERLDREPALLGRQVAARKLAALAADGQDVARVVIAGVERRQPLVAHQHQELGLRQIARAPRGRSREGPFSIAYLRSAGKGLAGLEADAVELLGGQALHRIAVDRLDRRPCVLQEALLTDALVGASRA